MAAAAVAAIEARDRRDRRLHSLPPWLPPPPPATTARRDGGGGVVVGTRRHFASARVDSKSRRFLTSAAATNEVKPDGGIAFGQWGRHQVPPCV